MCDIITFPVGFNYLAIYLNWHFNCFHHPQFLCSFNCFHLRHVNVTLIFILQLTLQLFSLLVKQLTFQLLAMHTLEQTLTLTTLTTTTYMSTEISAAFTSYSLMAFISSYDSSTLTDTSNPFSFHDFTFIPINTSTSPSAYTLNGT